MKKNMDTNTNEKISQNKMCELIREAQNGNNEIMNYLVLQNIGLIKKLSRKYANNDEEYEDYIQDGSIGLIEGIKRFDTKRNVKFSTYVIFYIRKEILKNYRIRHNLSPSQFVLNYKIKQFQDTFFRKYNRIPTIKEISSFLEVSEDMVQSIIEIVNKAFILKSLDETLTDDTATKLEETIEDKNENIEEKVLNKVFDKSILDIINTLPIQEQQVIKLRFYENKNQREIGDILGYTRGNISRIERKAIKTLKFKLENYKDYY